MTETKRSLHAPLRRRSAACISAIALLSILASAFVGCSGSSSFTPDTSGGACGKTLSRLQECGLATSGKLRLSPDVDPLLACVMSCYQAAACAELSLYFCSQNPTGGLLACTTACTDFRCNDGTHINVAYRCDGTPNCPDGSDESGCPTFQCQDGTTILASKHCDYKTDCADNSDEAGCPAYQCASGQKVPPADRCDGTPQCLDQTDETGCPSYNCANGQQVIGTARCDGTAQCTDGSDEQGCPPEPQSVCNGQTGFIGTFFTGTPCN